jgi:site-specific recombinase XerD
MRQALDAIASLLTDGRADSLTLDWAALRYKHTAALRAALMEKYSPATANKMLCALRRTLKEALRLELMDAKDYARAVDIKSIKVTKGLRGRALTEREITALMNACYNDPTPNGFRDAALIAILRGSGLRRREVVNLDLKDFNPSNGAILVRSGKGGKDRTVYLPESAIPRVEEWIDIRGRMSGSLLCGVNKAGRVVVQRLTPQAVLFVLQKRAKEASVASFSPHDFRRTFISDLLDAGTDIATVQKLAGHSSPELTSRYDRRGEETKRRAVQALQIPGSGRRKR